MHPEEDKDLDEALPPSSDESESTEEDEALDEGLKDKSDWPAHLDIEIKDAGEKLRGLSEWLDKHGHVNASKEVFNLLSLSN